MKTCFKCHTGKPLSEFYGHPAMGDGYLGKCKECTKSDASRHRAENPERFRSYDRSRRQTEAGRLWAKRGAENFLSRSPEKRKAHIAVGNAIRDGRLFRQSCRDCGKTHPVQAHHEDYSRPLDVIWLCVTCHKEIHKEKRAAHRAPVPAGEFRDAVRL